MEEGNPVLSPSTNSPSNADLQRWFVLRRDELRFYRNTKDVLSEKQAGLIKLVQSSSVWKKKVGTRSQGSFFLQEGMIKVRKATREVKRENSLMMATPLGTFFFSAESKYALVFVSSVDMG